MEEDRGEVGVSEILGESSELRPSVASEGECTDQDLLPDTFDVPKAFANTPACELCRKAFGVIGGKHHW